MKYPMNRFVFVDSDQASSNIMLEIYADKTTGVQYLHSTCLGENPFVAVTVLLDADGKPLLYKPSSKTDASIVVPTNNEEDDGLPK